MRLNKLQKNNYIDFALALFDNYNPEIVQNTIDNAYADFKEKGGKDWVAWNTFMFVHHAVRCTALKIFGGENKQAFNALTQKICEIYNDVLGIDTDKIYVKYETVANWGWNYCNF